MKNCFRVAVAACISAILLLAASDRHAIADPPGDAKAFVQEVATQVVATIKDARLTDEQRLQRYGKIFDYALDIPLIARISIGHHLRTTSREQRAQYFNNFRHYIIDVYAGRFGGHGDAKLEILGDIRTTKNDTLVNAKISGPNLSPKDTIFRVRGSPDGYKIVDVAIDGVSLVLTKRSEFNSIIYNHGIAELLEALALGRVRGTDPKRVFEAF